MGSVKDTVYEVLRKPRITEKAATLGTATSGNKKGSVVVFDVHPNANKKEIKNAVEKIFEVKVLDVRTVNTIGKGKKPNLRGGRRHDRKKAYITLAAGQSINVIEGL